MGKRNFFSEAELEVVKGLYSRYTIHEAAKLLPTRSQQTIRATALKLGIKRGNRFTHDYDRNYFDSITPESSYWAGFIAADGHINIKHNVVRLNLGITDYEHLDKFRRTVRFPIETKRLFRERKNRQKISQECDLSLSGAQGLIRGLSDNFSVDYNKSQILHLPDLEDDLLKCYMIGFCDGDGSVRSNRFGGGRLHLTFLGLDNIIYEIKDKLDMWYGEPELFRITSHSATKGMSYYNIAGMSADNILLDFSCCKVPFLMRKWQKVFDLRKEYENH